MSPAWIGVIVSGAALVIGLAVQGGLFAFTLGKHSQRLSNAESEVKDLKRKSDEHATSLSGIEGMRTLLEEVRHDMKSLLTGKISIGRRSSREDQ